MKILWISQNVPYPPKTGVLQRNYNLIREAARNAEVTVVAIFKEDILPGGINLEEARIELGKFCKDISIVTLPIESSRLLLYGAALWSLFTNNPFSVNWIRSGKLSRQIQTLLSSNDFDIIHFDTVSLASYRSMVSRGATVLNHHNIESHLLMRRQHVERNILKRFYYSREGKKLQRYEARVCRDFGVNFTVSDLDKDRLLQIAPGSIVDVVPNGVDTEYFRPMPDVNKCPDSIIMVSGMNWFPNRDAVLYMCEEIWPKLASQYPSLTWTVVGSSPPDLLFQMAKTDPRIEITGFVDDVRPYMARSRIYLCPMRDGGGTRLKILDALAMGMPVVGTSMSFEGISVSPELNVLVADRPDEFLIQIGRLLADDDLCRQLGEEAREFVIRNFSWEVIGSDLRKSYQDLTGGSCRKEQIV